MVSRVGSHGDFRERPYKAIDYDQYKCVPVGACFPNSANVNIQDEKLIVRRAARCLGLGFPLRKVAENQVLEIRFQVSKFKL